MANEKVVILTPLGRLVGGSVSKAQDKDADGKPYVIKSGPKAGQATVKYYVALAIPKQGEAHWASTQWGAQAWQIGHTAFPGIAQSPTFAWKIEDGDSQIPNSKGKKPCDRQGYAGNWIVHCSTSLPIKACNATGDTQINPELIKCGYYVQIAIMCQGNSSSQKPGIYLNPSAVALHGGEAKDEIVQGLDTSTVGFGKGVQLPAGVNAPVNVLTGAGAPPVPGVTPMAPPVPGVAIPAPAVPMAAPAVPAPNAAILTPPVPGVAVPPPTAPVAPPAPPAAPVGPQMKPGCPYTYAQLQSAGWSDAQMRAAGHLA